MIMIVDCGTTNLRVTLTDASGQIISQEKYPGGVRHTAIEGHNGRLKGMLKECMDKILENRRVEDVERCIAYGMITSNVGMLEIPHLTAPVSAEDLNEGMCTESFPEVAPFPISFIPGVRNFAKEVTLDNFYDMDMMRGEEVEAIGLYNLLKPEGESIFVLPGSHNKFVRMDAKGRILSCITSISGELLDAITHHTILSDTVDCSFCSSEDYNEDLACKGALECEARGLGRAAFSGRILNQLGGVESVCLRSYLLGATLAQDVIALRSFMSDAAYMQIFVAGKKPLQNAMIHVMKAMGLPNVKEVSAELTTLMGVQGALTIAKAFI